MSSKRIKLGFIGVGFMGQVAHLQNYAALRDDCEIVAIAELDETRARAVSSHYGIPRYYSNHEELFANEEVDALVASQPFVRHGLLVPELAKKGVPLLIEKPLASSVQAGEVIVESLRQNKTWAMVGYHKRSDLAVEYAMKTIAELQRSGELGKMHYIRLAMPSGDWKAAGDDRLLSATSPHAATTNLPVDPRPDDMDEAMFQDHLGFVNFAIHQVNLIRHFLGRNYQVSYADPAKILFVGHSEDGIPCTIELSAYVTTVDWQESALIAFEKGYIKVELPAPLASHRAGQIEIFKDPGNGATPQFLRPQLPWVHAMRNQAFNFIKAVRGEAPPPCAAPEALEDLKVARDYSRLLKGTL